MNREDLQAGLEMLKQEMEAGNITIAPDSEFVQSLKRVSYAGDGKVDPTTVDSSVSALLVAISAAKELERLREIPLRDIQDRYFTLLDRNFGSLYERMSAADSTPYDVALAVVHDPDMVEAWERDRDTFTQAVHDFWQGQAEPVHAHLAALPGLKAAFGGDMFPSQSSDVVASVGLYVDTIVLPDPMVHVSGFLKDVPSPMQLFLVVKQALNATRYRDAVLADVDPPVAVVAPDPMFFDSAHERALTVATDGNLLAHINVLFNKDFGSLPDALAFLDGFGDSQSLVDALAKPSRVLCDITQDRNPLAQIDLFIKEGRTAFGADISGEGIGRVLFLMALGRLKLIGSAVFAGARYGASPLVEAPTSWQYLLWKYQYDAIASGADPSDLESTVISRALALAPGKGVSLLGEVPLDGLLELRRRGALADLRAVLAEGVSEIESAGDDDVPRVLDHVASNVERALAEHRDYIEGVARAKKRLFGVDIPFCVIGGALAIASARTGNVGLAQLAAVTGLAGVSSIKEVVVRAREVLKAGDRLRRDPVAICLRHTDR